MDKVEHLAKKIRINNDYINEKARSMRSIAVPVSSSAINLSVCAVDGGLLAHRMHGVDIVVSRSVGVNFIYENSKLTKYDHHPSKSPQTEIDIKTALDDHEANVFKSLVRLKSEISCANELLDKYRPDLLLIDGSLLPLPSDIPSKESELHPLYVEVMKLYEKLFAAECIVCGIIKDSRARRLSDLKCSDSVLCSYLLQKGERTKEVGYLDEKNNESAFPGKNIKVTYIKPAKDDLPLRVEILGDVEKASTLIYSLSAISERFGYPAILIEADMCAALDATEIESLEISLSSLAGLKPLRRNFRPFR
ncbi:DNA double-strand break repair nuclease NurA [Candidatus Micrarchaeota archaeon]|nr:DNA double-strand break repair nuclease NurA [Candidatus Micrarchaeota archaeon]